MIKSTMRRTKRTIALLLAIVIWLGMLPAAALSEEAPDQTSAPAVEAELPAPTAEAATAEPTAVPVTAEPTAVLVTAEPTAVLVTAEPVTAGPTAEPISEDPTEAPATEEPTEEPAAEEPTEAPVTGEPVTEEPTAEPIAEEPTGEPATEEPTAEPITEEPTEAPVTEGPTAEPETEEPTAEPVTDEPTAEPTEGPTASPESALPPEQDGGDHVEIIKYPAMKFHAETGDLIVDAKVSDGVFPEGTVMRVAPVSAGKALAAVGSSFAEGIEAVDAVAADITFYDADGREVQPENGHSVHVMLTSKRPIQGDMHIAASEKDSDPLAWADERRASFDADHFTVYGIVGGNYKDEDVTEYIRHVYKFYSGDPSDDKSAWPCVSEQIVRDRDALFTPSDPAGSANGPFMGWYLVDENGDYTSERVISGLTVTVSPATAGEAEEAGMDPADEDMKVIKVFAKFNHLYKVTLYADTEGTRVYDNYVAEDGSVITMPSGGEVDDARFDLPNGFTFIGWKRPDASDDEILSEVTIDGADIGLLPVIKPMIIVSLVPDPLGEVPEELLPHESFTDQHVVYGWTVSEPAGFESGSVHDGYEVLGWYASAPDSQTGEFDEESKWDFTTPVTESVTLYAKWKKTYVSYKIVVMQEIRNPSDEKSAHNYEVWTQIPEKALSGLPGDRVDTDEAYTYVNSTYKKYDDNGSGGSSSTWHYHLSGTGVMNGENEYYAYTVEHNGEVVARYDINSGWDDAEAAVVAGDGNTVVRVYMCRDTYRLRVRFAYGSSDSRDLIYAWGTYFGPYVRSRYSSALPNGDASYGDLSDVNFTIRFRENMYSNVYLKNEKVRALMGGSWEFLRYYGRNTGKTRFDFTNQNYNLLTKADVGDGDYIYLGVSYVSNMNEFPFRRVYRNPDGTIREESTTIISYAETWHKHSFTIGEVDKGFRLVSVETGTEVYTAPGQQSFWFELDEDGVAKEMVITYIPVNYKITFDPNDGYTGTFLARNTAWPDYDDDTDFFVDDKYDYVVNDESGAGAERYRVGHAEVINGVLKQFKGWYDNAAGEGEPYDFTDKTIAAGSLTFYGKWLPVECTTFFHTADDGNGDIHVTQQLVVGTRLRRIDNPHKEGYVFGGWVYIDSEGVSHDFDFRTVLTAEQVEKMKTGGNVEDGTAEINLYPRWIIPGPYYIRYDAGAGEFSGALRSKLVSQQAYDDYLEYSDPESYQGGSTVTTLGTAEREGYVFKGWRVGGSSGPVVTGGGFEANEIIDADDGEQDLIITLTAQYEKIDYTVDVTYHSNYPEGMSLNDKSVTIYDVGVVNGGFTVESPSGEALSFASETVIGGILYRFVAWTNTPGEIIYTDDNNREYFFEGEQAAAGDPMNQTIVGEMKPAFDPSEDRGIDEQKVIVEHPNELWATWMAIEVTTVKITKVWDDEGDKDGIRPSEIELMLLADGEEYRRIVLNEENGWSVTYDDLPAEHSYSVEEVNVPEGYTVTYEGEGTMELTVTNAHEPVPNPEPEPEVTPEPVETPEPTPTDEPTPEPSDEPEPTPGLEDEPTPEPSDEPEPTPGPEDEPTPEPSNTPTPRVTPPPGESKVPKTGESSMTALWAALALLSAAGLALLLATGRKKRQQSK